MKYIILLLIAFKLSAEIPPELKNLPYAIYPKDVKEYNTARFNYNKRYNYFPKAIISPRNDEEIVHVLKAIKKYNLDYALRSGGHCYEPASLTSGYLIDMTNFDAIKPDVEKSEVYLGAGCRLGRVIEKLGKLNYTIPVGTCPGNCITGYTLGGGIGLVGRLYGLGCDSVKSIKFLTANAEVIEVNENNHPDLFWALRGGGSGSFGVALGFQYKMYYVPVVSYFDLEWAWNPSTFPQIYQAWQNWVRTLPDNISTLAILTYENGKIKFNVTGLKVGDETFTEWKKAFARFSPKVTITQESFLESSKKWASQSGIPFNKAKSKIMMEPLSGVVINKVVNYYETLRRNKPPFKVIFEFEAFGGKIREFDTSFFPRDAFGWWYQIIYWSQAELTEQALNYSRGFYSAIAPDVSIYSYANTVDYDIGPNYLNAYYGYKAHRLIDIKRKFDPENLFHWAQSIPLSKPVPGSLICE